MNCQYANNPCFIKKIGNFMKFLFQYELIIYAFENIFKKHFHLTNLFLKHKNELIIGNREIQNLNKTIHLNMYCSLFQMKLITKDTQSHKNILRQR